MKATFLHTFLHTPRFRLDSKHVMLLHSHDFGAVAQLGEHLLCTTADLPPLFHTTKENQRLSLSPRRAYHPVFRRSLRPNIDTHIDTCARERWLGRTPTSYCCFFFSRSLY